MNNDTNKEKILYRVMITNINEFRDNNEKNETYDSTEDTKAHVNRVSELLHEAS